MWCEPVCHPAVVAPCACFFSLACQRFTIMPNGSRTPVCTQWCMVGTCVLLMLATAGCGRDPSCDGRRARHRGNSIRPCLCCASYADTLAHAALRTVFCGNGGILAPDQGNCSICRRYLPPQSPSVPARLRTMCARDASPFFWRGAKNPSTSTPPVNGERSCPCEWEVWVSPRRESTGKRPTGHPGPTRLAR